MNNFYGTYYDYENGEIVHKEILKDNSNELEKWIKPVYSLLSYGTEYWQLQQKNNMIHAGYMSIGYDGKFIISPTPHGAFFKITNPENLVVNTSLDIKKVCISRFQLISAYSLSNSIFKNKTYDEVTIIGSGAVAIGAALEFLRQNYKVKILTKGYNRFQSLLADLNIQVCELKENVLSSLIIDCTGTQESLNFIIKYSKPNTFIGILGSPRAIFQIDLYAIHRKGICIIGLHELNDFSGEIRQNTFDEVCLWVKSCVNFSNSWFKFYESKDFIKSMYSLKFNRSSEPFSIFKW
jgi:hypothetical protein